MDWLPELAKQSIFGIMLVISLGVNAYLFKILIKDKDKQIETAEKVRDNVVVPIEALTESQSQTNQTLTLILDAMRKGGSQ